MILKKLTISTILLLGLFVSFTGVKAQSIVAILTCPMGCGVMEGNTVFGTMMAKAGEKLIVAAQETPGYMYNVRAMAEKRRWKKQVFGTEDVIIQLALQGGTPELKQFLPKPIPIKFKLLHGEGYWAQGKFFVTTNPDIKTIADMKGKKISIGLVGQSDWGVFPYLFLKYAYGIDESNSDIRRLNPGGLTQQLIDGTTDVAVTGYGTDPDQKFGLLTGPLRKLQASGKTLYYIPMDKWAIDKVNKKFSTTFIGLNLKAGTLPGQTEDFISGFNRGYKAAHPDFPEDLAYQFVMGMHKHGPHMRKVSKLFAMQTDNMMVDGLTEENAHPGAIRAFKELGLWKNRKKYIPVTYPK
jgi:TRAP transporter TAXI family solute receptor